MSKQSGRRAWGRSRAGGARGWRPAGPRPARSDEQLRLGLVHRVGCQQVRSGGRQGHEQDRDRDLRCSRSTSPRYLSRPVRRAGAARLERRGCRNSWPWWRPDCYRAVSEGSRIRPCGRYSVSRPARPPITPRSATSFGYVPPVSGSVADSEGERSPRRRRVPRPLRRGNHPNSSAAWPNGCVSSRGRERGRCRAAPRGARGRGSPARARRPRRGEGAVLHELILTLSERADGLEREAELIAGTWSAPGTRSFTPNGRESITPNPSTGRATEARRDPSPRPGKKAEARPRPHRPKRRTTETGRGPQRTDPAARFGRGQTARGADGSGRGEPGRDPPPPEARLRGHDSATAVSEVLEGERVRRFRPAARTEPDPDPRPPATPKQRLWAIAGRERRPARAEPCRSSATGSRGSWRSRTNRSRDRERGDGRRKELRGPASS